MYSLRENGAQHGGHYLRLSTFQDSSLTKLDAAMSVAKKACRPLESRLPSVKAVMLLSHGENYFVASTKRFINEFSANQNCCGDNFNCYDELLQQFQLSP